MTLIKTKEELQKFLAISQHTELGTIQPYLGRADREFLIPEIGSDLFNDALEYGDDESSSSSVSYVTDEALYLRLQEIEDNFAFHIGFDILAVHVSEAGIQRIESTDRKSAFRYQEDNLRQNLLESGYELLGNTLEFLDENKELYDVWVDDVPTYNRFKNRIIHTAGIFQQYFDIQNSWSIFFKIRSIVDRAEDLYLEPILGEDFLAEIKAEIVDDDETNAVLIELIRKAAAYLTMSNALHSRIVQLGKNGFLEIREISSKNQSDENDRVSSAIVDNMKIGEVYLKKITDHLNKNASADKYKTYFEGDIYQDPSSSDYNVETWTNTQESSLFIV